MMFRLVRTILRGVFSASFIGSAGIVAALMCAAFAVAFSTVWSDVIALRDAVKPSGTLLPSTTRLLFWYSSIVLLFCSAVTLDLLHLRERLARLLGNKWKLTTVILCSSLVCSVVYFVITFVATHVEGGSVVAERPIFRYVTIFQRDFIVPRLRFTREDGLTALFLILSSVVATGMFLFLSLSERNGYRSVLPGEFWGAIGLGFAVLALDELFNINMFIGMNAPLLRRSGIYSEPGSVILAFYAFTGLLVLLAYIRELRKNSSGFAALLSALVFQLAAIGFSSRAWRVEEALEIAEAVMFCVAMVYYAQEEIESYIQHRIRQSR